MLTTFILSCGLAFISSCYGQITLGTAETFGVLGASTVTNTGNTVINGDLGISPGTAYTGFGPGIVNGSIHSADGVSHQAQLDIHAAYNTAEHLTPTRELTGLDLGGMVLLAGVYKFSSSAQLTGTLVIDAKNMPNTQWVFQIGSTLTTASYATVFFANGAQPCDVFWQVGSSATLGTYTSFGGHVMALASVTATTGVSVNGGLFALTAAVTLDSNMVSNSTCAVAGTSCSQPSSSALTSSPAAPTSTSAVSTPNSSALASSSSQSSLSAAISSSMSSMYSSASSESSASSLSSAYSSASSSLSSAFSVSADTTITTASNASQTTYSPTTSGSTVSNTEATGSSTMPATTSGTIDKECKGSVATETVTTYVTVSAA
ncbi:hypothetical protein BP5796_12103 [Coleophoma crateriformis]|uniref:Antifreeze protein n=1 Tax=Coleophoma crateriformis TaxID=565419 RepID=A0A3D8QBM4_9HELO|nr:hypothetical protein BP5796_12103 [Coleophoma crateriformis]